ncbi:acyltransferase family protein [Rhizorhabdus sp. FW153]|uniref:acyltransferase family protein n=1 Tax=Rhizorhabdus sp. FW153 TaxID=3400216 RepID=UPI003CF44214
MLIPAGREALDRNNFDAIRLAMAFLVLFSHCFALRFGSEAMEPFSLLTNGYYNSGNVGVWAFFVISGFLVARSFDMSPSIGRFALRRVRRILPGYLVATSLCAFAVTPFFAPAGFAISTGDVVATLVGNLTLGNHFPIPDLFRDNPVTAINGSLWSIRFEALCYVGLALLSLTFRHWLRPALLVAYAGVVILWCWADLTGRKPGGSPALIAAIGWPYLWMMVLPNFLAGMIVYHWRDRLPRSTSLLVGLAGACLLIFHVGERGTWGIVGAHLLGPPTLAYAVFWLAYHPRIDLRGTARHGDFSYGVYLYAFVIQQMLVARTALPFPVFVIASALLSLAAGIASWWLVERPCLGRRRRARLRAVKDEGRPLLSERTPSSTHDDRDQTTP